MATSSASTRSGRSGVSPIEEGIRSPFLVRYPLLVPAGSRPDAMVLALDIAPTMLALAGGLPGPQVQGRSLVPLLGGRRPPDWRTSFLVEYWSENAMPWLVGMTYKAVRTERSKLIHWVNRDGVDELYDLAADPYELRNLIDDPARARERQELRRELARLVAEAVGL
jgi:arylsulfatase A-like enzyme